MTEPYTHRFVAGTSNRWVSFSWDELLSSGVNINCYLPNHVVALQKINALVQLFTAAI